MSYKIEIQNNFFVVTDTATGIEEIREVRDEVKWRVSGSLYSFFYNIPNLVDQNSPNIIRLGENAKEFDFSEIVDSTETPFASREIFNTLLNENLGFIIRETSSVWGLITGDINDQTDLQTILNGKFDVPTGDTTQYIAGDGTLITFPVAGQAGTLVREVKNMTGATLTKGTIVYINGANGNKPTVAKALATSDATSAQTFGFLQSDIPNNSVGFAVAIGDLTGLDTSAITEGTQLYLSSTVAGEYTTTKQVAPAHLVYVGIVTRSHPTLGQIEVKIQNGYELDELHDVLISGETDGQVLQFEGASGLWKNKTLATGLTVGSTAISGGADTRILYQNGGVLQQTANFTFNPSTIALTLATNKTFSQYTSGSANDALKLSLSSTGAVFGVQNTNASAFSGIEYLDNTGTVKVFSGYNNSGNGEFRFNNIASNGFVTFKIASVDKLTIANNGYIGIGQTSPTARLDILAQGALSTDLALRVRNSANTGDLFSVLGNGNVQVGVGGLSICRTDSPNGSLVGTFTYQTNSVMRCSLPLEVSGTYGRTGFANSQVALDLQYAQVNLRCFGGAGNTGFTFNTISATTGNHFMRIQNGGNDFLNVSSAGGFLFTNIATSSFAMPNASAKVQIDSTTQGFLPPRMTNAQRTAIATPAVGLMVYCTDMVEGLYIYKSTGWTFVI